MSILDGITGGGLGALAGRLGLSEEQVRHGLAALAQAANEHGDTIAAAQAKTGLPLDKLQALLAAVGGEGGIGAAGAMLGGGGAGGIGGALGGCSDAERRAVSGHHHHGHGHNHGHAHGHGQAHGHAHPAPPATWDRTFAVGIALNLLYVVAEAGAGLWWGSVALLADAGHNLSDVLGLAVAWGGAALARTPPSKRFTYGLKGSTILAALANALLLLVALGAIALEAGQRLAAQAAVPGLQVSAVAAAGIAVNGVTAWLFARGRHGDVNIRGAYLHMLSDAAVSAGVVAAGLLIWTTGAGWIDPLVSLAIVAVILVQTWGLLRETLEMAVAGVPRGIDYDAVSTALRTLPGVDRVHDLHIWPMSTTEPVLTAHLVMPGGHPGDGFLGDAVSMLHDRFGIGHATLQVETGHVETGGCEAGC